MTSSNRMLLYAGQRALLLAGCVTLTLVPSGAAADELPGRPGATPPIAEESIRKLREDYVSAASIRSTVEKRRALKRIALRSETLIAQNPGAPNRFLALGTAFKAQKELLILKSDRGTQEALLKTAGKLMDAPDAYADDRLPAEILLMQVDFRRKRAPRLDQIARIRQLLESYRDTAAEAASLTVVSEMLFELGDAHLLDELRGRLIRDFALNPAVARLLRERFRECHYSVRFSGAFTRVDGRVFKFPLDRLGHVYLSCYWSGKTPDLEKRLMEIKGLRETYPGEVEVFSFNLDERPDAGQAKLKELGLDWHAMHLPDGPGNTYFRCYGTDPTFLIRIANTNGYVTITPIGSEGAKGGWKSRENVGIKDLETYFIINRENPQYLSHVQSLRTGEFLVVDPFKPFDGTFPPELQGRGESPRQPVAPPGPGDDAVPEETLQAIQACFTPPPERYRVSAEQAGRDYEQAVQLCAAAMQKHPNASNLWIVHNRGIIARLGLWILRGDRGSFEEAVALARRTLADSPPPGADLVAEFCLAKQALREAESDFEEILAAFDEKAVDPARALTVGAAAVLSMDAGRPAQLAGYRNLVFGQHAQDSRLWSLSSFLAHKNAGGRLFRANYYGTEVEGRFYFGDVSGVPRTRLKMDFTTLEGKTVSIPGKDADKIDVVIFFDLPADEESARLQQATIREYQGLAKGPAGDGFHLVLAHLSTDTNVVAKLSQGLAIPLMMVPGGYRNPEILRLGVARANHQPNIFVVKNNGDVPYWTTGYVHPFSSQTLWVNRMARERIAEKLSRQEEKDRSSAPKEDASTGGARTGRENAAFDLEDFKLSELVADLDSGNYFRMPAKAGTFLREVLRSGTDFRFGSHDEDGALADMDPGRSPKIRIKRSAPPGRLGRAICHELLHDRDLKTRCKPIRRLSRQGLSAVQANPLQGDVATLTKMISHESVQRELEKMGFEDPVAVEGEPELKRLDTQLEDLETKLVPVSRKLADAGDRETTVKITSLQSLYRNLMLMVLRDQLLFQGAYAGRIDLLTRRYQTVLDFINRSTRADSRFRKLHPQLATAIQGIRAAHGEYKASGKGPEDRYGLLAKTMNAIYKHAGVSCALSPAPPRAPALKVMAPSLGPDDSFTLDGERVFVNVGLFTPYREQPVLETADGSD